jgi:cytokinin dehydrogenase
MIDVGSPALAAAADDFGHIVHRAPERVVVPGLRRRGGPGDPTRRRGRDVERGPRRDAPLRRLTPPVLADYLRLSVGGTLTVGGVGAMTARHGLQADNVLELDVVTGRGDLLTCSPERHPDLFDAVRAAWARSA